MNKNYKIIAHQVLSNAYGTLFAETYLLGFDYKSKMPITLHIYGNIDKNKPRRPINLKHFVALGDLVIDSKVKNYIFTHGLLNNPSATSDLIMNICNEWDISPKRLKRMSMEFDPEDCDCMLNKYKSQCIDHWSFPIGHHTAYSGTYIIYTNQKSYSDFGPDNMLYAPTITTDITDMILDIETAQKNKDSRQHIDNMYADLLMTLRTLDIRPSTYTLTLQAEMAANHSLSSIPYILSNIHNETNIYPTYTVPTFEIICTENSADIKANLWNDGLNTLTHIFETPDDITTALNFILDIMDLLDIEYKIAIQTKKTNHFRLVSDDTKEE